MIQPADFHSHYYSLLRPGSLLGLLDSQVFPTLSSASYTTAPRGTRAVFPGLLLAQVLPTRSSASKLSSLRVIPAMFAEFLGVHLLPTKSSASWTWSRAMALMGPRSVSSEHVEIIVSGVI